MTKKASDTGDSGGNLGVPPQAPDTAVNKAVDPSEVARSLGAFSAFLRTKTGGEELTSEVDGAANSARMSIEAEEAVSQDEGKRPESIPAWAREVPNVEKVFVKAGESKDIWHIKAEPLGRGDNEMVEVRYQYQDNTLTPGGTENEQGIPLEKIRSTFSLDEWNYVARPILERLTDAIELRQISRLTAEAKKGYEKRVKKLLPQVFRAGEIENLNEVDISSDNFNKQIHELLGEINFDPEILKDWIRELLSEEAPKKIEPKARKEKAAQYKGLHTSEAKKRLLKRFGKKEESLESYVDDLTDRISHVGGQLLFLNSRHKEGLYKRAVEKKDFEETPYMQKKLTELTEKAARQLEQKKGMVSIIGDMGTGKNYIVEHFAAKTNRPFFYFPCSRGMDAADLGFHFEFRKGESFVLPSALAKGLKTKNACILIDEPNALPPEVVAALHGLADHNRSFVYNGVEFKAAEGVVIIMTMNPATYEHVKNLPEAMSDRTLGQDMIMDYPPLTKLEALSQEYLWSDNERQEALQADNNLDKTFICDEALILRDYVPQLKTFSHEDFSALWDVIVNHEGAAVLDAKGIQAETYKTFIEAIFNILKVCQKWREKYKKGDMSRTISIRGSIAVVENFMKTKNVKSAFLGLYKPNSKKYDGGQEDYETLEQVMNDMQELTMSVNEVL
jgi:hypothetical protein